METGLIKDWTYGPLDIYRKKASFNWKKLQILLEGEKALRIKVHINLQFKITNYAVMCKT